MKPSFPFVAGLNLATIVLALTAVLRLANPAGPEAISAFSTYMVGAIFLHSLILLILALTNHPPKTRGSHWLSLRPVWLVGFGACIGGASISLP